MIPLLTIGIYTLSYYNLAKWKCVHVNGGAFALTPPVPVDPVLPNFNHVHIWCSEWIRNHSFGFTSAFLVKKNKLSKLLSKTILPPPQTVPSVAKFSRPTSKCSYPGYKYSKPTSIYSAPGWNFWSRSQNLIPTSECCTHPGNIRTPDRNILFPSSNVLKHLALHTPALLPADRSILSPGEGANVSSYTWWMTMQQLHALWPDQTPCLTAVYMQLCKFHSTAVEININTK